MSVSLPFAGLRVVDLSHFWSGPYLTMYLVAYGADVIKIESVQRPDAFRANHTAPALGERWHERSLLWQATNLGKKDITADLTSPEGVEIIRRLCASADVVVENYSVRVIDRSGLDYDSLRQINPRLVMLRLPGFGLQGPWRDYVGFGDAFEQLAGWATVTGYPDGNPQTPGGYADPIVGMHAGVALLAALEHRDRTGEGQLVEVPQCEVTASMAAADLIADSLGEAPVRRGNRSPVYAPQGVYRCADASPEFVAVSVRDEADWHGLVEAMGRPYELDDPGLAAAETRHRRHAEIDAVIGKWTAAREAEDVVGALRRHGVPAARLLRPARFTEDPHLSARKYFQEVVHPLSGPRLYPTFPMRFSFDDPSRAQHKGPAPALGADNEGILGALGYSPEQIADLERRQVIGTTPLSSSGLA